MQVPLASHPKWSALVSGKLTPKLEFFAAKILLSRLTQSVKRDPLAWNVEVCAQLLARLYAVNSRLPSAERDLAAIFGPGATP
jgi:hypothetical protein